MISIIAGLKLADRYDLSLADRNRVLLVMHFIDRWVGPAPAVLIGKHQFERLAPSPPPEDPRGGVERGSNSDGRGGDRGEHTSGSAPPDGGQGSGKSKK